MTQIIQSDEVIKPDSVTENWGEIIRIKAGAWIAGGALAIGTGFLVVSLWLNDTELRAWSTGLISLVVGTAIGFVFSNANRAS